MPASPRPSIAPLLIAASLGYFVDVYDLIIFSVVRTKSLIDLGVPAGSTLSTGIFLLNIQIAGLLIGGPLWGVLGDKLGRRTVLFGSIVLYSLANLANAYVTSIGQYECWRLIAGIGLAGELGAGVTLVSEVMPPARRGYGTMLIASVGLLGAVVAAECGIHLDWRDAYRVGAIMGFALLALRIGVSESPLFSKAGAANTRGNILELLTNHSKRIRIFLCTLTGMPQYFVIGILITASPEVGVLLGLKEPPVAGVAVMASYLAMALGGVASSVLSQQLRSRRKAIIGFHLFTGVAIAYYLFNKPESSTAFYWRCAFLGFGVGVWTVIVTNAAEQFGTNLRATAATLVPNLIRGMLIPVTWSYHKLEPALGEIHSLALVGLVCVVLAVSAAWGMAETFGKSLDYVE